MVVKRRLYECASCGRKRPADQMLYSRHTGKRYCRFDFNHCVTLGRRKRKREAVV